MTTFVSLLRWTDQGIRTVKDAPKRVDAAKKAFQAAGGEMKEFYLLMGEYDMLVIAAAPDVETTAKIVLSLSAQGNIRTETFTAFTEGEFRKVIASLP